MSKDPETEVASSNLNLSEIKQIIQEKKPKPDLKRRLTECYDTNAGAVGSSGCGCECEYEGYCGYFDTEDYIANEMCCTCGGGSGTYTDSGSTCEDTNYGATDS